MTAATETAPLTQADRYRIAIRVWASMILEYLEKQNATPETPPCPPAPSKNP